MSQDLQLLGDADIRPALRSLLLSRCGNGPDSVLVEELGVCRGQARIDIAVVNGLIHGYEIKSDRDSLRRLRGQIELFGKVLDRSTLVVGDRHLNEALEIVPAWWGILRVTTCPKYPSFETLRQGHRNPGRDPRALVELLWRDDAVALLEKRKAARGVRGKPRHLVWDRVCEHFSLDEIAETVRSHLKVRVAQQVPPRPS